MAELDEGLLDKRVMLKESKRGGWFWAYGAESDSGVADVGFVGEGHLEDGDVTDDGGGDGGDEEEDGGYEEEEDAHPVEGRLVVWCVLRVYNPLWGTLPVEGRSALHDVGDSDRI